MKELIFLPLGVGLLSTTFSKDLKTAPKSKYQPPPYVFSIVWPILYLIMGYSSYIISKTDKVPNVFFIQLLLNFTWSIVYTRLGVTYGLINIILLLIFSIITYIEFYKLNQVAANFLIPYILWICFATFLNITAK